MNVIQIVKIDDKDVNLEDLEKKEDVINELNRRALEKLGLIRENTQEYKAVDKASISATLWLERRQCII